MGGAGRLEKGGAGGVGTGRPRPPGTPEHSQETGGRWNRTNPGGRGRRGAARPGRERPGALMK
eukprot:1625740-Lingulodinium_polyedra.AAC.1